MFFNFRISIFFFALIATLAPSIAQAQKTKAALTTEINTNWPDNTVSAITPALLRSTVIDIVNSYYDLNGGTSLACAAHQWVSGLPTLSSLTCTQPAFSDISGTATAAQGGTGNNNSTNSANDVLASNGANGNFVHTALLSLINAVCTISPSGCNFLFGHYSVLWFGFSCTGASEANIIQTVHNALPSNGGTIYIPPGSFCNDNGTLTVTKPNVNIIGGARATGNGGIANNNVSRLNYNGTAARYLDAHSGIIGFVLKNINLTYSSASFTGSLVAIDGYNTIEDNFLGPDTNRTGTATLLDLSASVDNMINRNFFYHGYPSVLGQNTVQLFKDNVFSLGDGAQSISGCGEAWTLDGNSFEALAAGTAGAFANTTGLPCTGMVWKNNWFGDITVGGGIFVKITCYGCVFEGNRMAGNPGANTDTGIWLNLSKGIVIQGNAFDFLASAIACAASTGGLLVTGNNFGGFAGGTVTTAVASTANCTPNYVNQAND